MFVMRGEMSHFEKASNVPKSYPSYTDRLSSARQYKIYDSIKTYESVMGRQLVVIHGLEKLYYGSTSSARQSRI